MKIKQAIIPPIHDLDLADSLSNLYLVLSWLCLQDEGYRNHWIDLKKNKDCYIILDNGANEGKLSNDDELIKLACDMGINEVVTPDVYLDWYGTVDKTKNFLIKYHDTLKKNNINTMSVLQGKTEEEFNSCFDAFVSDNRVNILGVGYRNLMLPFRNKMEAMTDDDWIKIGVSEIKHLRDVLEPDTFYYTLSRLYFLTMVVDYNKLGLYNKKIHLLGLMNPYELSILTRCLSEKEMSFIRGCDSAAPVQAAQANVIFDVSFGVVKKPKALLDFEKKLENDEKALAIKNIEIMKGWLSL